MSFGVEHESGNWMKQEN